MNLLRKIYYGPLLIRLRNWEYWPFGVVQFPVFLYWLWLSVRARSLVFFSACNPGIVMGGMFGESKYDLLERIPSRYVPLTIRMSASASLNESLARMRERGLKFPVVCKPDYGERGWKVRRVDDEIQLQGYLDEIRTDFIIQAFVDLPLEFGVFYYRYPHEQLGRVNSVVRKEMLAAIGNGKETLGELIRSNERAIVHQKDLTRKFAERLDEVLPDGYRLELVSIGNHCLGTKFLDASHLITPELSKTFDHISKAVDGFFFGRYDLRCASVGDLTKGNVMVMELNGCGAEPGHIYHPGYTAWRGLRTLIAHWRVIFRISIENHKRGIRYTSLADGIRYYRMFRETVGRS